MWFYSIKTKTFRWMRLEKFTLVMNVCEGTNGFQLAFRKNEFTLKNVHHVSFCVYDFVLQ